MHIQNKDTTAATSQIYLSHPIIKNSAFLSADEGKGKGKAIPLQAWTGLKGSRRMKLPDFKTIGT